MRITTLIENRPGTDLPDLVAEWGLSLHIAFDGHSIFFDAGISGAFADNANRLSVDVGSGEVMVLSHYHYDHGGGLRRFLELNSKAKVYQAEAPNGDCTAKIFMFHKKYVGLDKEVITDYPDRFVTVAEPTEILPKVFVFPHIRNRHPRPIGNKQLFLNREGNLVPDDFTHEIVMAIDDNGELVVFTGCSHSGLFNMLDTVTEALGGIPIKAVIGGFHLIRSVPFNFMAGSKHDMEQFAKSILNYPVGKTYTGHCTGAKAFGVLKSVMGDRIHDIRTGTIFDV